VCGIGYKGGDPRRKIPGSSTIFEGRNGKRGQRTITGCVHGSRGRGKWLYKVTSEVEEEKSRVL